MTRKVVVHIIIILVIYNISCSTGTLSSEDSPYLKCRQFTDRKSHAKFFFLFVLSNHKSAVCQSSLASQTQPQYRSLKCKLSADWFIMYEMESFTMCSWKIGISHSSFPGPTQLSVACSTEKQGDPGIWAWHNCKNLHIPVSFTSLKCKLSADWFKRFYHLFV